MTGKQESDQPSGHEMVPICNNGPCLWLCSAAPEDQGMPLSGKKERSFQVRSQGQFFLFLPFSSNKGSGTALCSLGDFLLSTYIYKSVERTFLIKLLITQGQDGRSHLMWDGKGVTLCVFPISTSEAGMQSDSW